MEQKDAPGQADELQDPVSPAVCTQLTFLLRAKSYLGVLPIGSDVCLPLRTLCEHWSSFGCFASWFLRVSDVKAHLCWKVFVCDSVLVILVEGFVTVLSSGVCVCVCAICVTGILVAFVKWEIQVHFIRKTLATILWLKKKKDNFLANIQQQYFLDSRKKWWRWNSWNFKTGSFCICS